MGCVYMATNRVNGKAYIGKTKLMLCQRKAGHFTHARKHCRAFRAALDKYGRDAFSWKVLFRSEDDAELLKTEAALIDQYQTIAPLGYNLTTGGRAPTVTDETRRKHSVSGKKRWSNPAFKERNAETREKMLAGVRKRFADPEYRKRIAEILKKANLSPARREKISKIIRAKYATDPEYCRRRLEAIRAKCKTPEWIENHRLISSKRRNKLLDAQVCVICGKIFSHPWSKKTCGAACFSEVGRRNSVKRWREVMKRRSA